MLSIRDKKNDTLPGTMLSIRDKKNDTLPGAKETLVDTLPGAKETPTEEEASYPNKEKDTDDLTSMMLMYTVLKPTLDYMTV
jgi:hypothetical protein